MKKILYKAVPFRKEEVTLALESGVDGLIVPNDQLASASNLARCQVLDAAGIAEIALTSREDESRTAELVARGKAVILRRGWEIIPVENLLAREHMAATPGMLALETVTPEEAALASGILEKGVDCLVVTAEGLGALKSIVDRVKLTEGHLELTEAVITEISPAGLGHRVCVDTLSLFKTGQGMLVGNSAALTFLVNAETEQNEYVASRPFRINAGAVHSYTCMPGDGTAYLSELQAGAELLIVDQDGGCSTAVVGRVKVEKRPMLLIRAKAGDNEGSVFVQNAETIRLVQPGGKAASVVDLVPGDSILCRIDQAGRHFGMRIREDITEV